MFGWHQRIDENMNLSIHKCTKGCIVHPTTVPRQRISKDVLFLCIDWAGKGGFAAAACSGARCIRACIRCLLSLVVSSCFRAAQGQGFGFGRLNKVSHVRWVRIKKDARHGNSVCHIFQIKFPPKMDLLVLRYWYLISTYYLEFR